MPSYDLRPFELEERRLNLHATRSFVYIGLGFTGLGVAIAIYLAVFVQFDPWVTSFILVLFCLVGFMPLLIVGVPGRRWRDRVKLLVDESGIAILDSSGHSEQIAWTDPEAVVTIREILVSRQLPSGSASGEHLLLMPGAATATIGKDAREGILAACEAHGYALGEDQFDIPNPADRGRTAVPAITRIAARPPPGGITGPPSDSRSRHATPLSADGSIFPAPETQPSYIVGAPATQPNPISEIRVARRGAQITLRNGKTIELDWRAPRLRIELFGHLPYPVSALTDVPAWRLSVTHPRCQGSLTPEAYAAWTESARAAGLVVVTSRFPRPNRGSWGWGAVTTVRRASPSRNPTLA